MAAPMLNVLRQTELILFLPRQQPQAVAAVDRTGETVGRVALAVAAEPTPVPEEQEFLGKAATGVPQCLHVVLLAAAVALAA